MAVRRQQQDSADLVEEIQHIEAKLADLHLRMRTILTWATEENSLQEVSLILHLLELRTTVESFYNDIAESYVPDHLIDVKNIWHIIESHSSCPATVIKGTHLLERFFHMRMRSIIQPSDYHRTMAAYLKWQLLTVRCFTEQYQQRPRTERLNEIGHLWNWNHRDKEAMFFDGAARPLHLKTVTEFSELMSVYYDSLWLVFKDNRHTLAEALN